MNTTKPKFHFADIVKRKGFYLISKKSLEVIEKGEITKGVYNHIEQPISYDFHMFLIRENLVLLPFNDKFNIIKKLADG